MRLYGCSQTGGCSDEDMEKVVKEQESSRGDFPGPMPVIVRYSAEACMRRRTVWFEQTACYVCCCVVFFTGRFE